MNIYSKLKSIFSKPNNEEPTSVSNSSIDEFVKLSLGIYKSKHTPTEESVLKEYLLYKFPGDYHFDEHNKQSKTFNEKWDSILNSWLDYKIPFTVGAHTTTFHFPHEKEVEIWTSNAFYGKYGRPYRLNDNESGLTITPSLKTMLKLEIAVRTQMKILESNLLRELDSCNPKLLENLQ